MIYGGKRDMGGWEGFVNSSLDSSFFPEGKEYSHCAKEKDEVKARGFIIRVFSTDSETVGDCVYIPLIIYNGQGDIIGVLLGIAVGNYFTLGLGAVTKILGPVHNVSIRIM